MFSSNAWKNIQAKPMKNFCLKHVIANQSPKFRRNSISATSGFLYGFLNDSDNIIVGSSFDLAETNDNHLNLVVQPDNCVSITDLSFHPLHDDILAFSGRDSIEFHRLPLTPQDNITITNNKKLSTTIQFEKTIKIDQFRFHPTFEEFITIGSFENQICYLFDITKHNEPISIWKKDEYIPNSLNFDYIGRLILLHQLSSNKNESVLSLLDCRLNKFHSALESEPIKCWNKSQSRVLFLDGQQSQPYILLTLLDTRKNNNVMFFDRRNFTKPLLVHVECGLYHNNPNSIYIPKFDADTGIVFFVLKNRKTIVHCIVNDLNLDVMKHKHPTNPFENNKAYVTLPDNIIDCSLLSKRSLNVNNNQIDCLVNFTPSGIFPINYYIPSRKSFIDSFAEHLYPDTFSPWTKIDRNLFASNQCELNPAQLVKFSNLNLNNRNLNKLYRFGQIFNIGSVPSIEDINCELNISQTEKNEIMNEIEKNEENEKEIKSEFVCNKDSHCKSIIDIDQFKYLKGLVNERKFISIPRTSYPNYKFFQINEKFAFFITGDLCNRLSFILIDSNDWQRQNILAHIHCPARITCFALDPFNPNRLGIGLNNGIVQIYIFPTDINVKILNATVDDMLLLNTPNYELNSVSKCVQYDSFQISSIQFHTMADEVMAVGIDKYILLWDLEEQILCKIVNIGFSLKYIQWNPFLNGGIYIIATGENDLLVKDISSNNNALSETLKLPKQIRNYRCCWALTGKIFIISAVNNDFHRKIYFFYFDTTKLNYLNLYEIDVSPSILVPWFDEDSNILFLSGSGDTIIYSLALIWNSESQTDEERLLVKPLAQHFHLPYLHQAIDFWPKQQCNVRQCEINIGFRLMTDSIDKFRFIVPRTYPEYFHDELYPPTYCYSKPLFNGKKWFLEINKNPKQMALVSIPQIDLKPNEMISYSSVKEKLKADKLKLQKQKQIQLSNELNTNMNNNEIDPLDAQQHQDALVARISNLVQYEDKIPNKNDDIEGVESDEWGD